jgi:Phosphopantetheine attachment site.
MDTLRQKIVDILKIVASDKKIDQNLFSILEAPINLRNELQLDSLDLAELGVRLEDAFGLDIFENGPIVTLGDIIERIKKYSTSSISTHG